MTELEWNGNSNIPSRPKDGGKAFDVQFNPESLKVNFANQKAGGDQPGGSPIQFVGSGTTKLALELFFDVTVPVSEGKKVVNDVRTLTADIAYFMKANTAVEGQTNAIVPPGIRFHWGTFLFDGVMDSMDETLEYFSEKGYPLRATVSISLSRQEILYNRPEPVDPAGNSPAGTQTMQPARAGDSLPKMAGRSGKQNDWKKIAAANDIENPRQLPAGTLVNLNAK
ncbi:MAG: peptidoglycan-binding protein [Ardenticatenaceae bacterium]|nr:peptidoglycan-binding protein [Ardenticatenaceae bacterium]